jgi:GH24 family phage-related lysozyme (muramidase)
MSRSYAYLILALCGILVCVGPGTVFSALGAETPGGGGLSPNPPPPWWLGAVVAPLLTSLLGLGVGYFGLRLDIRRTTNQELIKKRLEVYEKTVPLLDDLLCFFLSVGSWKTLEPPKVVDGKRDLDRLFNIYGPLFSKDLFQRYQSFAARCFSTSHRVGSDARLRADIDVLKENWGPDWNPSWDERFAGSDATSSRWEIVTAYRELMSVFSMEIGTPTAKAGIASWLRRRRAEMLPQFSAAEPATTTLTAMTEDKSIVPSEIMIPRAVAPAKAGRQRRHVVEHAGKPARSSPVAKNPRRRRTRVKLESDLGEEIASRNEIGRRASNEAGIGLIASSEGLRLQAYQDIAGNWTVGYGHVSGVQPGMTITDREAVEILKADLADAEASVEALASDVPTDDNQFAAMVSLCFNIGSGNFRTSSVLRQHRAANPSAAADAFLLWDKAHVNGQLQVVQGLLNRRQRERDLYLALDA